MRAVALLLACGLVALLLACGLIAGWPVAAAAAVEVTFVQPERFSDARRTHGGGDAERLAVLAEIQRHLERLGSRHLASRQVLKLSILDIDLAGRFEPWRALAYDLRFLRDVTWPSMRIRYVLEEDGVVVLRGEETVNDMAYLTRAAQYSSQDPLRYEKTMLSDWFRARIIERRPPRSP